MNKKERRLALATALQSATADMIVVESLAGKLQDTKTKSMVALLEKVGSGSLLAAWGRGAGCGGGGRNSLAGLCKVDARRNAWDVGRGAYSSRLNVRSLTRHWLHVFRM